MHEFKLCCQGLLLSGCDANGFGVCLLTSLAALVFHVILIVVAILIIQKGNAQMRCAAFTMLSVKLELWFWLFFRGSPNGACTYSLAGCGNRTVIFVAIFDINSDHGQLLLMCLIVACSEVDVKLRGCSNEIVKPALEFLRVGMCMCICISTCMYECAHMCSNFGKRVARCSCNLCDYTIPRRKLLPDEQN